MDDLKNQASYGYGPMSYKQPNATVDVAIFTIIDGNLHVLTVKRAEKPFNEMWSLVGGYVDIEKDKNLESTATRKLQEKTGVQTPYLEQFETIGNADRDPRGWSITTVYFALISSEGIELKTGKGTNDIKWSKIEKGKIEEPLAFDHAEILQRCIERLRNKVLYTSLPIHLMPNEFTLSELQKVYEIILGQKIEHKSFRRRMLGADILIEAEGMRHEGRRPAQLYRVKEGHNAHFFIRNLEGAT
ncbi:MAG: NUDIX hydrolase [Alphaproteobacteria bacterium]|nr:NUDIX hydrolase [Alphaproteobacteria bacterium]